MNYDNQKKTHAQLEKEFAEWKDSEDEFLRILGFPETKIQDLREYDHGWFVNSRRRRQDNEDKIYPLSFFDYQPYKSKEYIISFWDLLNSLENEVLFLGLKKADPELQKIIMYRYEGYSVSEISEKMNISSDAIYKKIQRFRKKFK